MVVVPSNNDNDNKENERHSSLEDEMLERAKNTLGNFETNLAIKNAVLQIPHIGETLYAILGYMGHMFGEQRLLQCLAILQEQINLIDENKIDKEFLRTEFFDILRITIENSMKTRHRERIMMNFKILAGALNKDKLQDRHYAEDFVYSVADLPPTDIMVGIEIYKLQRNRPDHFGKGSPYESETDFVEKSGIDKLRDICKLDEVEFDIAIHKLFAAALIKQSRTWARR